MSRRNSFQFEDNSGRINKALRQIGVTGMTKAASMVEDTIKPLVPVDTGALRDHITHTVTANGSEVIGKVGTPHKYGPFVEFGTGEFAENGAGRKGGWTYQAPDGSWVHTYGSPAQPFLRPGFRAAKSKIEKTIGDEYAISFKGGG